MPNAPDGIFRSQAYVELEQLRAKLADDDAAYAIARAAASARMAELEALEQDRLLAARKKALGSRIQAGRTRIASAVRTAKQIELEVAALDKSWRLLLDEIDGFKALGGKLDIDAADSIGHELYRAAGGEGDHPPLPGFIAHFHSMPAPISETIEAEGKEAIERFADYLLTLPSEAA